MHKHHYVSNVGSNYSVTFFGTSLLEPEGTLYMSVLPTKVDIAYITKLLMFSFENIVNLKSKQVMSLSN